MLRSVAFIALLLPATGVAQNDVTLLRDRTDAQRPALLVIGSPHFANPGRDNVNREIENVRSTSRQREIEEVVQRLSEFRPTIVAVEWTASRQDELDARYAAYRNGEYELSPSELDQLGLRIAAERGLERVVAVDWNEMPPGEIADFDFEAYAANSGREAHLEAIRNREPEPSDEWLTSHSVLDWLRRFSSPEHQAHMHRIYFDFALLGHPGANWVANWHGRNLKIFSRLVRLAEAPEDRVLVIYGAGHGYLLNRFGEESGAFTVVDPADYLGQ